MPAYRAADLVRIPNLVSLLRLPLAAAFPRAARAPAAALAVLGQAALSDMLDGWLSRRMGQVTALGAVVDPVADKVFTMTAIATLVRQGKLPRWGVGALLSREILEAPLFFFVLSRAAAGTAQRAEARANAPGKLATMAQFAAIIAAVALPPLVTPLLALAGVTGVLSGIAYWRRELGAR